MTEKELADPGDQPFYFQQHGWNRLQLKDVNGEFWFRKLTENGLTLQVFIELTPGGRRKFYVEDPPDEFRAAAHDGRCLTSRGVADGENIFRVHFKKRPESIADGVWSLREMLRGNA
ncbi:hypothetical protein [Halobaculum sp. EA56]|uniref:hypothetical protein n=1 Tax=Halobaculum sp. EA56 TaxID=3421648 RepID=UPI003EBE6046